MTKCVICEAITTHRICTECHQKMKDDLNEMSEHLHEIREKLNVPFNIEIIPALKNLVKKIKLYDDIIKLNAPRLEPKHYREWLRSKSTDSKPEEVWWPR